MASRDSWTNTLEIASKVLLKSWKLSDFIAVDLADKE